MKQATSRSLLTWRMLALTQLVGLFAAILISIESGNYGESINHTSLHFVFMSVYCICALLLAAGTDVVIARGGSPRVVYPVALLMNPVISSCLAFLVRGLYFVWFTHGYPLKAYWEAMNMGLHMSEYGAFGLLILINQRTTDRMLERVRGAELKRVQLDQHLLESRLATAEAQIDPTMLFASLRNIRVSLAVREPDAEPQLTELIQKLRNALARTAAVNLEAKAT
jgi:hypothetical protein